MIRKRMKFRKFNTRIFYLVRATPTAMHQTAEGFLPAVSDGVVPLLFKTKKGALLFGPCIKVRLSVVRP